MRKLEKGKYILALLLMVLLTVVFFSTGCAPRDQKAAEVPAAPAPKEKHTWEMQSWTWSGLEPQHSIIHDFAKRVSEMSGGRLEIQVHPREAVVPHWESTEAVGKGILDISFDWPGVLAGRWGDVGFNLFSPPPMSLREGWQVTSWFYDWGVLDIMREAFSKHNVYVAGVTFWQQESLHSKKPIRGIADLRGVKVRTPPGITSDFFRALGASPVVLPPPEIYSSLDRGVIDAAEWVNPTGNFASGFQEVTKYVIWPSPHQEFATIYVAVNKDSWNALSPELKAIFKAALAEFSWRHAYTPYLADYQTIAKYVAAGNEHIRWSDEELRKARVIARDLWRSYGKQSPLAATLVEKLESYLKTIGKMPE